MLLSCISITITGIVCNDGDSACFTNSLGIVKLGRVRITTSVRSMFLDLPALRYGIFNSLKPIKLFGTGVVPVFTDPFIIRAVPRY